MSLSLSVMSVVAAAALCLGCNKASRSSTLNPTDSLAADSPAMTDATNVEPVRPTWMDSVVYTPADSAEVERLLAMPLAPDTLDVMQYAMRLVGRPYVGQTLERHDPEVLIVNLKELDCATFVETVLALTTARRKGQTNFDAYCRHLARWRYRQGRPDGYLSRLHYFTWWSNCHLRQSRLEEVPLPAAGTARRRIACTFMGEHAEAYPMLVAHPEWTDSIKALERAENGDTVTYLKKEATGWGRKALPTIQDGDIIAILTSKKGLDYAHLGFAKWGRDGRLHLLNASMLYHRVVLDEVPLETYLSKHPSFIGIRLFRLKRAE